MPIWSFLFVNLRQRMKLNPAWVCVKSKGVSMWVSPLLFSAPGHSSARGVPPASGCRNVGPGAGSVISEEQNVFRNWLSAPVDLDQEPRDKNGLSLSNLLFLFPSSTLVLAWLTKAAFRDPLSPRAPWATPHRLSRVRSTTHLTRPTGTDPQHCTGPGQPRAQTPAIWCLHCREPQSANCDAIQNSHTWEESLVYWELISLLYWLREVFVKFPNLLSRMCSLVTSLIKPVWSNSSTSVTFSISWRISWCTFLML